MKTLNFSPLPYVVLGFEGASNITSATEVIETAQTSSVVEVGIESSLALPAVALAAFTGLGLVSLFSQSEEGAGVPPDAPTDAGVEPEAVSPYADIISRPLTPEEAHQLGAILMMNTQTPVVGPQETSHAGVSAFLSEEALIDECRRLKNPMHEFLKVRGALTPSAGGDFFSTFKSVVTSLAINPLFFGRDWRTLLQQAELIRHALDMMALSRSGQRICPNGFNLALINGDHCTALEELGYLYHDYLARRNQLPHRDVGDSHYGLETEPADPSEIGMLGKQIADLMASLCAPDLPKRK